MVQTAFERREQATVNLRFFGRWMRCVEDSDWGRHRTLIAEAVTVFERAFERPASYSDPEEPYQTGESRAGQRRGVQPTLEFALNRTAS